MSQTAAGQCTPNPSRGIEQTNSIALPATDKINKDMVRLVERQQAVIDRLFSLKDRLFGAALKSEPDCGVDPTGPGKIGEVCGNLSEAHCRMTSIENLVDELSQL